MLVLVLLFLLLVLSILMLILAAGSMLKENIDSGMMAADGVDSAQKEIALWFTPKELAEYEKSAKGWIYESAL